MSSINRAENSLDDRLVNVIKDHDRFIRELKTGVQQVGADALKMGSTVLVAGGPLTLSAGGAGTVNVSATPTSSILTTWNFLFTVYVDGSAAANQWPSSTQGTSTLTAGQRNAVVSGWMDWADSSDVSNVRVHKIRIRNDDSVSHDYYFKIRAYLPLLAGTGAA